MSRRATLVDLPNEVLVDILTPVLRAANPVPVCPCKECNSLHKFEGRRKEPGLRHDISVRCARRARPVHRILSRASLLSILLIHPIIYPIALELFYTKNDFILVVHNAFNVRALKAQDKRLWGTQAALRRIRRMTVQIETWRWPVRDAVAPLLHDMATHGRLHTLNVKLFEWAARTWWLEDPGLVRSMSMLALLRAMADLKDGSAHLYSHRKMYQLNWRARPGELNLRQYDILESLHERWFSVIELKWAEILQDMERVLYEAQAISYEAGDI